MDFSILGILTLFILFISFLLTVFMLTVKTHNKKANLFLGFYFLIFSIHISVFLYSKYIALPPTLEMLRDHIAFLTSPLLFLYMVSSIYSDFKCKPKHVFHVTPFLIQILIFSPGFYLANTHAKNELLENLNNTIEGKISIIFGLLVSLFYLVAMFIELRKYKQLLLENYSNKSVFNYRWLFQLLILLSSIFILSLFKQVYKLYGTDVAVLNTLRVVLTLVLLVFLSWIVLKSMYYPNLFRNINSGLQLTKKNISSTDFSDRLKDKEEIDRLLEFMDTEKPYLDSSLTLQSLADSINKPQRELSIIINQRLNQHFFDFINQYRIRKAQKMLSDLDENTLTIQQIMYDVGFNSKSSFYTAFKKQTGVTPSEYRKKN